MSAALRLREDDGAGDLRALARGSRDANQTRRLLARAAIYEGASRGAAAVIGGVQRQTVRDWVAAVNAHGPAGLIGGKASGQRPLLDGEQRAALRRIVEGGPTRRWTGWRWTGWRWTGWRLIDLRQGVFAEFGIAISKQTLSRMLRQRGYRKLSARPRRHAQDPAAPAAFKKISPHAWQKSPRQKSPRAMRRAGRQKCGVPMRRASGRRTSSHGAGRNAEWAQRGARPSAPCEQRTAAACIFGAVCPKQGKGAALVLPRCSRAAMTLHLAEIAKTGAPGAHAVLMLDQAGWHGSDKLVGPANITLPPLPPKCPELNPVENLWQYLRENWLSNRIFRSHPDILEHRCYA